MGTIAALELRRATIGWVPPSLTQWTRTLFTLRDTYYPGDLGFDPLGLKPTDADAFANIKRKNCKTVVWLCWAWQACAHKNCATTKPSWTPSTLIKNSILESTP